MCPASPSCDLGSRAAIEVVLGGLTSGSISHFCYITPPLKSSCGRLLPYSASAVVEGSCSKEHHESDEESHLDIRLAFHNRCNLKPSCEAEMSSLSIVRVNFVSHRRSMPSPTACAISGPDTTLHRPRFNLQLTKAWLSRHFDLLCASGIFEWR
jgi:hypothetical protein